VAESEDGGDTWEMIPVSTGNNTMNDILLIGNTGYIVGDGGMLFKMQSTISVNEYASVPDNVKCYPNPCTNRLFVDFKSYEGRVEASVYNQMGQVKMVRDFHQKDNNSVIDVSGLADGMYFLKITDGVKSYVVKFWKR
jgi:hypothetical protein